MIDREIGLKQMNGNEELLNELIVMFVQAIPDELAKLNAAHKTKNWKGIQSIVHRLKGGATYCGMVRLKEACSQLESYFRVNTTGELTETLYHHVIQEMQALKDSCNFIV